jgi:hypothetical protein
MKKIHLKTLGVDARRDGQTEHEYSHQTACGYVREHVTEDINEVNCFYCKRSESFIRRENLIANH